MDILDQETIKKRLLLAPISVWSMVPLITGVTIGLGSWAINMDSPLTLASGLMLGILSVGIYLNSLIFGWDKNYEKLVREWRNRVESERDQSLNQLYLDLQKDGDERTEHLLKDLRTLTKALLSEQTDRLALSAVDILSDVDKLFQRSVDYLKESLELWNTAQAVERKNIRNSLIQQREAIIHEVEQSLDNLGLVLSNIKKASIRSSDGNALSDLRDELSARLRIAEQVETRMEKLRRSAEMNANDEAMYLKYAQPSGEGHNPETQ